MTEPIEEYYGDEEEEEFTDEELAEAWEADRIAQAIMITKLETKYADRGLKFTIPFAGCIPVQAYGHLDDLRFYFRFRGNFGQLRLGPYDLEIEELTHKRNTEQAARWLAEAEAKRASGESSKEEYEFATFFVDADPLVTEDAKNFYPTRITKASVADGADPEDYYNGSLTDEEAFDMFSLLADTLEDIPEADQINDHTRIWLYEGLDAARATWDNLITKVAVEDEQQTS